MRQHADSLKPKIIAEFEARPASSSAQIGKRVGCSASHVRRVLSMCGLSLRQQQPRGPKPEGVKALGRAAQAAGLTTKDIERFAATMREAAE